jgi:gas vesicle protein
MGERPDQLRDAGYNEVFADDPLAAGDAEIQQTREEISETLDAIQSKFQPDRLAEDAKDVAQETVDHLLEEGKATAEEVSEIASVAAMEAVDYATKKVQELLPDVSQQAREAAQDAVDHAVAEAKAAVRELGEQTRAALRDATIGRVERMAHTTTEQSKYIGSSTIERIKQNPGPAALAALGISWLVMSGKGPGAQTQRSQPTGESVGQTVSGVGQRAQDTAGNVVGTVQETADAVANQVQTGVSTAAGQVQQAAGQVAEQVQTGVSTAAEQVQQTAGQVTTTVQQVPGRTRRMIEDNPIPLGLVALALGGAAALAIPETRKEHQIMGEARDALIETAQAKGQEVAEKAQNVVENMQTAVEGVEETVEQATK